jgi:putative permease
MAYPHGTMINKWTLLGAAVVLILLVLLVPGVVKLVIFSLLLAYIFDPIVTMIELRGLSRTWSTVVFFGFLGCIGWILVATLAPVVIAQLQTLQSGHNAEQTAGVILRLEGIIRAKLGFLGLGDFDLDGKIHSFGVYMNERVEDFVMHEGLTLVVYGVAIPFIVFFLLKDGREIKKQIISIVPNRYFEFALDLVYKMDVQLGNYLRSQFSDAVVFGILSTLALWILGVKYFIFIGPFAGLANLIPYVGPIAGALPAIAVSLFETGDVTKALQVVVAFTVLKLLDDVLIQPLLVAKGVNLHPLLVLVAIIVGGELFGILGMLLAVPATGFVKVVLQESIVTLRKYRFTD